MSDPYVEQTKIALKTKLRDYMEVRGVKFSGSYGTSFQCPIPENHKHGDRDFSGSMSTLEDGEQLWQCHGCKESGSIFEMAEVLQGLDTSGRDFYMETIPELAKALLPEFDPSKYFSSKGEKYEKSDLDIIKERTPELIAMLKKYNAWEKLTTPEFNRNYSEEAAKKIAEAFYIAQVPHHAFEEAMGGPDTPLNKDEHKRDNAYIFSANSLLWPLFDKRGRIVGFQSRASTTLMDSNDPTSSDHDPYLKKYRRTKILGNTGKELYNFHHARKPIKKDGIAIIMESISSCQNAYIHGIQNCLATQGTSISENNINDLISIGCKEVVFFFDGDKAGREAAFKQCKDFSNTGLSFYIIDVENGADPDELITGYSKTGRDPKELIDLDNRKEPMEIALKYDLGELDNQNISKDTRILLSLEMVVEYTQSQHLFRRYAKVIANKYGEDAEDIFSDLVAKSNNYVNPATVQANNEINDILKTSVGANSLDEKLMMVDKLSNSLKDIVAQNVTSSKDQHATLDDYYDPDNAMGKRVLTGFEAIDSTIEMFAGQLIVIGAKPSVGKSTWCRKLIQNLVDGNEHIFTIYACLDDSVRDMLDGMVVTIAQVQENVRRQEELQTPETIEALENAKKWLYENWERKYVIYGQNRIQNMDALLGIVKKYETKFPDKIIAVITDNLYNISDIAQGQGSDKRIPVEKCIDKLNLSCNTDRVLHIVMAELKKTLKYRRPTKEDLKETGAVEYRAKVIGLMHNDIQYERNSMINWMSDDQNRLPVIEFDWQKYKKGQANIRNFIKADPRTNEWHPARPQEIARWEEEIVKQSATKGKGGRFSDDDSLG